MTTKTYINKPKDTTTQKINIKMALVAWPGNRMGLPTLATWSATG